MTNTYYIKGEMTLEDIQKAMQTVREQGHNPNTIIANSEVLKDIHEVFGMDVIVDNQAPLDSIQVFDKNLVKYYDKAVDESDYVKEEMTTHQYIEFNKEIQRAAGMTGMMEAETREKRIHGLGASLGYSPGYPKATWKQEMTEPDAPIKPLPKCGLCALIGKPCPRHEKEKEQPKARLRPIHLRQSIASITTN